MNKVIPPDAWDFQEPLAQPVRFSQYGLRGSDLTRFMKRASHPLAAWAKTAARLPGEEWLHLIALGSTETVGCFPAGTEVRVGDGTLKAIETLRVGDQVVTHTGHVKPVMTVFSRPHVGDLVELDVQGQLEKIRSTSEHPYYVIRREQVTCEHDRVVRCTPATVQRQSVCSKINCPKTCVSYRPEWVTADDVRVGDFVLIPVPGYHVGRQAWALPPTLARLGGLYLAEGSVIRGQTDATKDKAYGMVLSFGATEAATLARQAVDIAEQLIRDSVYTDMTVRGPHVYPDGGEARVHIRSKNLMTRMLKYFGSGASGKRLAGEVFQQAPDVLAAIVGGYVDGDGHQAKVDDRYTVHTVSRQLALDLQWVLTRFHVPATVCEVPSTQPTHKTGYHVSFAGQYGDFLSGRCDKYRKAVPLQVKAWAFAWNGYICQPVRAIQSVPHDGLVFNIEVEGDHSYTVGNGVAVHNCNRNADGYTRKMLERDHPTFEKCARWFRHHNNSDLAKSYGVIKKSHFDPLTERVELLVALNATKEAADRTGGLVADVEMEKLARDEDLPVSQSCFPAGELVWMADGSKKPIEDVRVGDAIITHTGKVRDVVATMQKPHADNAVRFKASGLPVAVTCTADHKVWVRPKRPQKQPCPACGKVFRQLASHVRQKTDAAHVAARSSLAASCESWVQAGDLVVGDYVRTPFSTEVTETGDADYARLLGYYLAEGSIFEYQNKNGKPVVDMGSRGGQWYRGVDFTFAAHETKYADEVVRILRKMGYDRIKAGVPKSRPSCYHVRVSSPELADRIEADAGRYSDKKRLAPRFLTWSPATQLVLLGAYFEGDGCFHRTNETLTANTVSSALADQVLLMLWRNGIPARRLDRVPPQSNKKPYSTIDVSPRFIRRVPCDKVPVDFEFAETVTSPTGQLRHQTRGATATRKTAGTLSFVEGGFVYRRIDRVERVPFEGTVYDLTVGDDDHSYVVRGVAVSNCNVPKDVCMGCGNSARHRGEYCGPERCKYGGCRDNLGRTFDDGFKLYVDNPHCRFFDISLVTRGADPTAFVTGKVAGRAVPGGAELAEALGIRVPDHALPAGVLAAVGALKKLAAAYANPPPHCLLPVTAADWAASRHLPASGLPAGPEPVREKLAALAANGVVLPPTLWLAGVADVSPAKAAAVAGDSRLSLDPRAVLDAADRCDRLAAAALPDAPPHLVARYAAHAPTASTDGRLSVKAAAAVPRPLAPGLAPPAVLAAAADGYLCYQAHAAAKCAAVEKNLLLTMDAVRHNRVRPS